MLQEGFPMPPEFVPRRKSLANDIELIWYLLAIIILGIAFSLLTCNITSSVPGRLIYLAGIGAIEVFLIWNTWRLMRRKQLFDHGSAIATATIVDRRVEKEPGWSVASELLTGVIPTRYAIYYVRFELDTTQAVQAPGIMRLEAVVEKDLYERLTPGTTVQVRYATHDPRVVLLEGED
jgi:hypothetical protein